MHKKIILSFFWLFSLSLFSISVPEYSLNKNKLKILDDFIEELISHTNYYEGFEKENNIHTYCLKNPSFKKNKCGEIKFKDRRIYFLGKIVEKNLDSYLHEERSNNSKKFGLKVSALVKELDSRFNEGNYSQKKLLGDLRKIINGNKRRVSDAIREEFYISQKYLSSLVAIDINSDIFGAKIYLNNKYLGRTPLKTQRIYYPGKYNLQIKKAFLSIDKKIDLSKKTSHFFILKNSEGENKEIKKLTNLFKKNQRNIQENITTSSLKEIVSTREKTKNFIYEFKNLGLEDPDKKLNELNEFVAAFDQSKVSLISKEILEKENNLNNLLDAYDELETIDTSLKKRDLFKVFLSEGDKLLIKNDLRAEYISPEKFTLDSTNKGFLISISSEPINVERKIISENLKRGSYQSGTIEKVNEAYIRAKNNHDVAYNNYIIAKAKAESASQACYEQGSFLEMVLCGGILNELGSGSEARAYEQAKYVLDKTPPYIKEKIYEDYQYRETIVKAKKNKDLKIHKINLNTKKYEEGEITLEEEKTFYIYSGLDARDINPPRKQNSEEELDKFLTQNTSKFKLSTVLNDFEKEDLKTQSFFSSLNEIEFFEDIEFVDTKNKGFFSRIISFFWSSEPKTTLSADKKSDDDIDERFLSVVSICTLSGSCGTGFYVKTDLIVSNQHVVDDSKNVDIENYSKSKFIGEVIKTDKYRDLALIKVQKKGTPVRIFSDSKLKPGTEVIAIGNPLTYDYTLSKGVVSAVRKLPSPFSAINLGEIEYVQTDTAINGGNSGGPLFHDNKVVGVNTWGVAQDGSGSRVSGVNFAVSYKELIDFLE